MIPGWGGGDPAEINSGAPPPADPLGKDEESNWLITPRPGSVGIIQESKRLHPDCPAPDAATDVRAAVGVRRLSIAHFLVALVVLLVTVPFVEPLPNGRPIEAALMTLVLLSAVLAVGGRRRMLIVAAVHVTPAAGGTWVDHFRPDLIPNGVTLVASIVFVAFVVGRLLGFILRAPRVNSEVLCAGIATYLMLGLLWTFAYALVARLVPHSFAFTVGSD